MPIKFEKVTFGYCYPNHNLASLILKEVNLEMKPGKITALIGENGSGKSTFLQLASGLLKPLIGKVTVNGYDLSSSRPSQILPQVGMMFQIPERQFFANTVFDEIAFGLKNLGLSQKEIKNRIAESLRLVGLEESKLTYKSPFSLSGGQMRLVALASILAIKPNFLLVDEPLVGLDNIHSQLVINVLSRLATSGYGVVFATHDLDLVAKLADQVFIIQDGRIEIINLAEQLFLSPQILAAAGLELPEIGELILRLRENGYQINSDFLNLPKLAEQIVKEVKKAKLKNQGVTALLQSRKETRN